MKKDSIHLDTQFWDKCINYALVFLFLLPKFTTLNFQNKKKITRKNIFIHSFFFFFFFVGGWVFVEKKKKEILFIILLSLYAEI